MTPASDNVLQRTDESTYHEIKEYHEEYAVLMESEQERETCVPNFRSSDSSVNTVYQATDCSQCKLMDHVLHLKSRLAGDQDFKKDAVEAPFLSHDAKIGHKCSNRPSGFKSKCLRICLSMSLVWNIGLGLVIVLLVTTTKKSFEPEGENCDLQHLSNQVLQDSLCIPCNNLGSQMTSEDTLFDVIYTCGSKFCCVRNAAMQRFFLLHITAATDRLSSLNNTEDNKEMNKWRSREVAAHLYANITSLPERLTWRADVGFGTALLSGITLTEESRLMVPRAGYYFIYSAVTFRCQDTSTTRLHLINRQHKGRPTAGVQQLLLSKSSECVSGGFYTSFLSGVLKLTRNDEISVYLTKDSISNVYASSLSNFFGCYIL